MYFDDPKGIKLNNRGLSLVELIIAISIGVIVSGSIAALITFALRTYRNESVNTSMQYELQSNINMMMDEIMGASAFVVEQAGSDPTVTGEAYTKYAMFGNPNATVGGVKGFKGVIFVPSAADSEHKFKIYMKKVEKKGSEYTSLSALAVSESAIPEADAIKYLLGENATQFVIIPDPVDTEHTAHVSLDDTKHTYTNPIPVKVELQFERNGWGTKKYSKHVNDTTYLRNKVTESIYVKNAGDTDFLKYELKKKED